MLKIKSNRRVTAVPAGCLALIGALIGLTFCVHGGGIPRGAAPGKDVKGEQGVSRRCIPEPVPSGGLEWSRRNYPRQYEADKCVSTRMAVVEPGEARFEQRLRAMDVAGNTFSRPFLTGFDYADSRVSLRYLRRAETFVAELRGRGLKPNFAYQIKLRGIHEHPAAFERIGRVGRWRLPGEGINFSAEQYRQAENKEEAESYLFFDFLLTDSRGNAYKRLYADSSLHVLLNPLHQRNPEPGDSLAVSVPLQGTDPGLYANPRARLGPEAVYAQTEAGFFPGNDRPPIGSAYLPPGHYRAELVLTEESFHGYGDAGRWATVLRTPVEFEVLDRPHRPRTWSNGTMVGHPFKLEDLKTTGFSHLVCEDGIVAGQAPGTASMEFRQRRETRPPRRYYLSLEYRAGGTEEIVLMLDNGDGFEWEDRYRIESGPEGQWQRAEVEVTSRLAGRYVRRVKLWFRGENQHLGLRELALFGAPGVAVSPPPYTGGDGRCRRFEAETLDSRVAGSVAEDPRAENGLARAEKNHPPAPGALVTGPYIDLAPGTYRALFRLRYGGTDSEGRVAVVDVVGQSGERIAKRALSVADVPADGSYRTLPLSFETREYSPRLELRVFARAPGLWVDWCAIEPEKKGGQEAADAFTSDGRDTPNR
jgi:hypothetical protein